MTVIRVVQIIEVMQCLGGVHRNIEALAVYDSRDPWAVVLRFFIPTDQEGGGDVVEWVFGRELLVAGLRAPAGEGDVTLCPLNESTSLLTLEGTAGAAIFEVGNEGLWEFIQHSWELVPIGAEFQYCSLEEELRSWL